MKMNLNKKQQYIIAGAIIAVLVAIIGVLFVKYSHKSSELDDFVELMAIEKEELEEQYEDLYIQFDGYQQLNISNDSLQDQLSRERQRVQDLLEELRQTKASNAQQIKKLKDELKTVREVAQNLMVQVDSLNRLAENLTKENMSLTHENQQVKQQNTQLTNQNTQLQETVSRASMLEITSLNVIMLDKNDRKTRYTSRAAKLEFDFEIAKNITCPPGVKDLYARIMDPEGNLLGENEDNLFQFESDKIPYTLTQQFEFSGEAYTGACYYQLTEEEKELKKEYYTIDFVCDGNLIGSFPFMLKK